MSKYVFTPNQRYAVYKAFNGRCQWCYEPVEYKNFHVDHVIPEELLSKPDELQKVLHSYGLSDTFNINDYENWIPAHPNCNQRKSDKAYVFLPLLKTILDNCEKNKELEQRIELRLNKEPEKSKLLASVQAAINLNLVNLQELQTFILGANIME